jgi:Cd2+/Zn2+-exporting ATPase
MGAIAFDKTGTLTAGKLQVTEVIPVAGYSENQVLQLAAALESCSEHPIGEAIALAAKERNLSWQEAIKNYYFTFATFSTPHPRQIQHKTR